MKACKKSNGGDTMKKAPKRYTRTKEDITAAFIHQMNIATFDKISITSITSEAKISRSTFYSHYEDIYDLLFSLLHDFVSPKDIQSNPNIASGTGFKGLESFLQHFFSYKKLYLNAFRNDTHRLFSEKFHKYIEQLLIVWIKTNNPSYDGLLNQDLIITFYTGGCTAVLINWLENNCTQTPQDVTKKLELLMTKPLYQLAFQPDLDE